MIFANTTRCRNIGDAASSPFNYLGWPYSAIHIDTRDYNNGPAVMGGGGLLHPGIEDCVYRAVTSGSHPRVLWGVGSNYDPTKQILHPHWLSEFDLVGLRDFGCGYRYVPCASCMHPAFDKTLPPGVEIAIYEHRDNPITLDHLPADVPRMNNWADQIPVLPDDIDNAISFIVSASLVITNSYHGVYWAMLAGRKVLLYQPSSTRFSYFKHRPTICLNDWQGPLQNATTAPPEYLAECRELNRRFYKDVLSLFDQRKCK